MSAGGASDRTCTCRLRSTVGASTHTGGPSRRGGTWSTWRNRGTRRSRLPTVSRTASIRNLPSASTSAPPSNTATTPMSIGQPACADCIVRRSDALRRSNPAM